MPYIRDPEVAEALTAWRAVCFGEELGAQGVVFEGDALNVVNIEVVW
jgi:hypothetical protein